MELTETSPVISVNPLRIDEIKFETVGPVLQDVKVKIAEDGEILSKGPNLMMGYYKAPELTAEVIDSEGSIFTPVILAFWRIINSSGSPTGKKRYSSFQPVNYIAPQPIENRLKESFFH